MEDLRLMLKTNVESILQENEKKIEFYSDNEIIIWVGTEDYYIDDISNGYILFAIEHIMKICNERCFFVGSCNDSCNSKKMVIFRRYIKKTKSIERIIDSFVKYLDMFFILEKCVQCDEFTFSKVLSKCNDCIIDNYRTKNNSCCVICTEPLHTTKNRISICDNGHIIHRSCCKKIINKTSCPLCRQCKFS